MRRLLALLLVLALVGCGGNSEDETAPPATVTVTETVVETETVEEEEEEPPAQCSTAGVVAKLPEQDLPEAVADVRQRVFDAALACDYDTLEQLALEKGEGFTFSYGGDASAAEFWREREERDAEEPGPGPLRALATILAMPYTRNEAGSYAWPTAYSESPTDEAWEALTVSGLYTQAEVDAMRSGGTGYLGYRTAITPDGDWQFFVAGD